MFPSVQRLTSSAPIVSHSLSHCLCWGHFKFIHVSQVVTSPFSSTDAVSSAFMHSAQFLSWLIIESCIQSEFIRLQLWHTATILQQVTPQQHSKLVHLPYMPACIGPRNRSSCRD